MNDKGHDFRPMTSNRTRCDVCGRTAGVPTHVRPPKGSALSAHRYATCSECGRAFDLYDEHDADEWTNGHDCEVEWTKAHEQRVTETELRALWGDR